MGSNFSLLPILVNVEHNIHTSATIVLYIDPVLPRLLATTARAVHALHAHGLHCVARRSNRAAV